MIQVLLFAGLKDKVGASTLDIQEENITIDDLRHKHLAAYGADNLLDQAMVAVNEEYAEKNTILKKGDVVAFVPPVSGG
ncbi:MAG TPA: molybdopterin converting factor subunit 1 [Pseudogracilibacillus sp.]|nr:molybdopterin converting factor subunit 1 [Pseudogracilibacillus sp.]